MFRPCIESPRANENAWRFRSSVTMPRSASSSGVRTRDEMLETRTSVTVTVATDKAAGTDVPRAVGEGDRLQPVLALDLERRCAAPPGVVVSVTGAPRPGPERRAETLRARPGESRRIPR